jgi:hypothetical protein
MTLWPRTEGPEDDNLSRFPARDAAGSHLFSATQIVFLRVRKSLWNSTQGTVNAAGNAVKFTVPTVAKDTGAAQSIGGET